MTHTVVIARFNETDSLIELLNHHLVRDNHILYNKGTSLNLDNEIVIPNVPIFTREGDCYLRYIIDNYDNLPDYLFFTQANPFDHSPHFLQILETVLEKKPDLLKPFLPLTNGWDTSCGIPPRTLIEKNNLYSIGDFPVHIEYMNDFFEVPHLKDYGLDMALYCFRDHYKVSREDTLKFIHNKFRLNKPYVAHAYFHYAGIFGVCKEHILRRHKAYYVYLNDLLKEIPANGYILERLWLSIFS
jgi:hypothetical protein